MHTNSRRFTAHVGWTRVALLFLLACAAGCSKAPAGASTRLLTTIPDVRALPVELAGQGWPVRVRGVVTYADHEWGRLFIQDQDAAVAVDISADHQPYAPGEARRRGWMDGRPRHRGGAAGASSHDRAARHGVARLPALDVPLTALSGSTCNGGRLQTTGDVKELSIWNGYLRLHVVSAQHSVEVRVLNYPLLDMTGLVGTSDPRRRRLHAGPGGRSQGRGSARHGERLLGPRAPEALRASMTRATDSLPVMTRLDEIRRMSRAEAGRYYPVRVAGIATYVDPAWSMLFLQDGATGIFVALQGAQGTVHAG